jgi:peptidoglycan/LPS O-acetylase OafA/YrhL
MSQTSLRLDIEGLRAVAILLVLAFHAGLPVPGGYVGVDVFFVISGFLISGLLVREYEATGAISMAQFYARRARRLLPAATVVLLGSALAGSRFGAATDRATFAVDAASAAAYIANWRFADRAVDYLAEDVGRSPVLHFWSLSVEEQFYLVWPALIILALSIGRRMGWAHRRTLVGAIQLVLLPSLAWSIVHTNDSAQNAFFVTSTRLWELGLGAMLALLAPGVSRVPRWTGEAAAWLGAGCILFAAVAFDQTTSWPGYRALLPTLGTVLVIYGGTRSPGFVGRALSIRPMVWIGGASYSIYLWHWPFLVAGQDWFRLSGPLWGLALTIASIGPAWLSQRFIENPIRTSSWLAARPQLTLSLAGNLSLIVVAVGFGIPWLTASAQAGSKTTITLHSQAGRVTATPKQLGAGALGSSKAGTPQRVYTGFSPSPSTARGDLPRAYAEGCQMAATATQIPWCKAGDADSKRTMVILGDSKILQYYEALDAAGSALGIRVVSATMSSCASTDALTSNQDKPYTRCAEVNAEIMRALEKDPPFAVVTSQNSTKALDGDSQSREAMVAGLVSRWTKLRKLGTEVVVVLDNPRPPKGESVYECLLQHPEDQTKCAFSRQAAIERSAAPVQLAAAAQVPGVHVIDLTNVVCPKSKCAPVIGDVLVYRQGSHVTNTYARTLAPHLTSELARVLSVKP